MLQYAIVAEYDPRAPYQFDRWKAQFEELAKRQYGKLHGDLLYTNVPQNFSDAILTFEELCDLLSSIGE